VTTRDGRGESLHGLLGRGLAVVAVVLALGLGTTAVAAVQTDRHLDHVTDLFFRTVTEGDLGYLALVEAEISVRAYAATGDPLTLSAFETYIAGDVFTLEVGHRDLGGELAEHLGDDHPTVAARRSAEDALETWYVDHAVPIVEAVRAGGPDAVPSGALDAASAAFEQVRAETERYLELVRDERHRARDSLERW